MATKKRSIKKKDATLENAGRSFIEEKLLSGQHIVNEVLEVQFPVLGFTLDEKTVLLLDTIREPLHNSRGAMARQIIKEVMDFPDLFPLADFYQDIWRNVFSRSAKRVVQLLLPGQFNLFLRKSSKQILETENRSEMFRIVVALYAIKKGIAKRKRSECFEIELDHSASSKPHD